MASSESSYQWPQFSQKPSHLAVILDGNGRWAKQRNKARIKGHIEGRKAVKRLIKYCVQIGIPHLSIYAFSTENWRRDPLEVKFIVDLIFKALATEIDELHRNGVKVKFMHLPLAPELKKYQDLITKAEEKTASNTRLSLQIMFNYGSQQYLLHTFNKFKEAPVSLEAFEKALCEETPFPEIMIRTGGSGRARLSNFMLWELAYAELFFLDVLWPDFQEKDLEKVLLDYQNITRNFGDAS